jgi:hypothetical protein
VDDRKLGLRAATDHRHDPVADRKVLDVRTDGCDHAGKFEAGDVSGDAMRRRVVAGALQEVGCVEARSPDCDQKLAHSGNRVGPLSYDDRACLDYYGAHDSQA